MKRLLTKEKEAKAIEYLKLKWDEEYIARVMDVDLTEIAKLRMREGIKSKKERKLDSSRAFRKIKNIVIDDYTFNGALHK